MTGLALLLVGSLAASLSASLSSAQPPVGRAAPASLDTTRVKAARAADSVAGAGRTTVTLSTRDARLAGASSVNALLALLPYATLRSARGETGLSLRGARREQVAITLDGMPLNDPATGIADVSDLPLAGVQSATVALGADPVGTGSGATGGVLALTTSAQRVLSVRAAAFGQQQLEGAWYVATGGAVWHASASVRRAANDFAFVNTAGESAVREVRVNNDEQRAALSLGVIGQRAQLAVLASSGERGMVGAANVRTYDADRARTDRLLIRGQWQVRGTTVIGGTRRLQLQYRDPTRPALDTRATAWASDAEWRGVAHGAARGVAWRLGGGVDQLVAAGGILQRRRRAFGTVARSWRPAAASASTSASTAASPSLDTDAPWWIDLGARVDLIESSGALPTASLGAERRLARVGDRTAVTLVARVANAVRVPTLYDLYFSSPQRLFVRALAPERVGVDAATGLRLTTRVGGIAAQVEGALVARDTRDAIVWFPGNFGWSPANVGIERLRGVESRATLVGRAATASGWLTTYHAQLHTGGLHIPTPYVPRQSGGAQLQLHPLAQAWVPQVALVWRAMGARPYTAGPRSPDFELPAVSLIDLTLAQRLRSLPHWPWPQADALLALSMENATNVAWQSVRGFPSPGRSWAVALTLQHSP